MDKDDKQKNISQSQGVRLARPGISLRPKNRIEPFLPQINKEREAPVSDIKYITPIPTPPNPPLGRGRARVWVKRAWIGVLILAVVGAIGYGSLYIYERFNVGTDNIVAEVGKLVELPVGELPTIATVTDLEPLKDQPFFKDAKVGDKVLIFGTSKRAILYRPSEKKIIAIAPLNR